MQRAEGRGQKTEDRGKNFGLKRGIEHRGKDRDQRSDVRSQKSEDRRQRTEGRISD